MTTRSDVVLAARSYLDTPYHHMGRWPGIGVDCAGLIICVGRDLGLVPADFDVPSYKAQPDGVSMLQWCDEHMGGAVAESDLLPGHVIVVKSSVRPQHLAILGDYVNGGLSIIHAAVNATPPRVIETRLMFSRTLAFVAGYRMPGVADFEVPEGSITGIPDTTGAV